MKIRGKMRVKAALAELTDEDGLLSGDAPGTLQAEVATDVFG